MKVFLFLPTRIMLLKSFVDDLKKRLGYFHNLKINMIILGKEEKNYYFFFNINNYYQKTHFCKLIFYLPL